MGGAMRHISAFLPELSKQDSINQYHVLVRAPFPRLQLNENVRLKEISSSAASSWSGRLWNDVVTVPRNLAREGFDLVVSLTNFGPIWSPVPHILFQRNSLYYCPYYLEMVQGMARVELSLRRRLAVESMKRADLVVTPSDGMAKMIKESCPGLRSRSFKTLYHGFDKANSNARLNSAVALKLRTNCLKLLYATHASRHKGFEVLFPILSGLKRKGVPFKFFTTASREDWAGMQEYIDSMEALDLLDEVVFLGRIPQSQMGDLYRMCDLLIFPSLCESFGFPMLEALCYGLPVVAAKTPVNEEICADAAVYYNPEDIASGISSVENALSQLPNLKERSLRRASSFDWSWQRYTRQFRGIIEEVVGMKSREALIL